MRRLWGGPSPWQPNQEMRWRGRCNHGMSWPTWVNFSYVIKRFVTHVEKQILFPTRRRCKPRATASNQCFPGTRAHTFGRRLCCQESNVSSCVKWLLSVWCCLASNVITSVHRDTRPTSNEVMSEAAVICCRWVSARSRAGAEISGRGGRREDEQNKWVDAHVFSEVYLLLATRAKYKWQDSQAINRDW